MASGGTRPSLGTISRRRVKETAEMAKKAFEWPIKQLMGRRASEGDLEALPV